MRSPRPIRKFAAATLAVLVAVVGLVGVPAASAKVEVRVIRSVAVPSPTSVAITSDNATVLAGSTNSNLYFIEWPSRSISKTLNVSHDVADLVISPSGETAYLVSRDDDLVVVINMFTRTVTREISLAGYSPNQIAITPDGTALYLTEDNWTNSGDPDYLCRGRIIAIDLTNSDAISAVDFDNTCGYGTDIVVAPDGSRVYAAFNNGNMKIVDSNRTSPTYGQGTNSGFGSTRNLLITPDGSTLYGSEEYGSVLWCSIPREESCPDYDGMSSAGTSVGPMALSPDGKTLYGATPNGSGDIEVFDLDARESTGRYEVAEDDVVAIAASTDNAFVVTANIFDNTVSFMGGTSQPKRPRSLDATPGNGSASVSFRTGFDGASPITKYQYQLNNGSWVDAVGTTSPILISGLTNGTRYSIKLRAVNSVGAGEVSTDRVSVTPQAPKKPARPTALRATAGDQSVSVAFTAGSDGGSPITKYQYQLNGGSWTDAVETASPITIGGLTNYTDYRIAVRAVNAVDSGAASNAVKARPRSTGPVLNTVTVEGTSITANFSGVLFGGVNGYRYTVNVVRSGTTNLVGGCMTGVSGRSCTVNFLNPDEDYDVTVTHWFRFPADPLARTTLPSNTVTVRTAIP